MFSIGRPAILALLKLALPLVLTGLMESTVFFFDTLFLAKLGPNVMAAGALVSWLAGTFWLIFFSALAAINLLVAYQYGAKNREMIAYVLRDGLRLSVMLVIPSMLLFWFMADSFSYFGQSEELVALSRVYLQSLVPGMLPSFMSIALLEFLMGLGEASLLLKFSVLSSGLNIGLTYLLIFGKWGFPAMGIAGAGWGWTIGTAISFMVLLIYLWCRRLHYPYFHQLLNLNNPRFYTELLKAGIPMGLMYSVEVAFFLVQTFVMGTLGDAVLAANQVVLQFMSVLMSIIFSIAQAVTVSMGHLLGAGKVLDAKKAAFSGIWISVILAFTVSLVCFIKPELMIAMDFDIHDPKNADMVHHAKQFFMIGGLFQIFEACRVALFGALRALRDTHFTLMISIFSFWLVALPLGYSMARFGHMGGVGLWWGMMVGVFLSVLILCWRFNFCIKKYGE